MKVLLGLCLFSLAVCHVSALECYNCIMGCNDEFKAEGVSKDTCTGSCMKTKTDGNVIRNCLPIIKKDECEEKDGVSVCVCTSNLCNTATIETMSTFAVITTFACVFLNTFRNIF
ncbi:uncharacterized protein LOC132758681 isoform X1 [Ruditapes philippinarum]|uniref:uncharacterized protein LOC132758681 isoform X1 n=1 Tax=Ruditapes philippinarum TaxID=129788 RepID=UPI00295C2FC1|nr:uncharacterized protein LOC132758681 isoform X1 [Ruditapes philippinarum]